MLYSCDSKLFTEDVEHGENVAHDELNGASALGESSFAVGRAGRSCAENCIKRMCLFTL